MHIDLNQLRNGRSARIKTDITEYTVSRDTDGVLRIQGHSTYCPSATEVTIIDPIRVGGRLIFNAASYGSVVRTKEIESITLK